MRSRYFGLNFSDPPQVPDHIPPVGDQGGDAFTHGRASTSLSQVILSA